MTQDLTSGMQYHYDAGNVLKTVGSITYWYDNDGQRYIKWNNGVPVKSYFYGADGEILAEGSGGSTLTAEYIFFNGKRIARVDQPGNAVHYYLSDALNTTSMEVSSAGVIENESDYYPWGGELKFTANDPANPYKFSGKERDSETGLDDMGARYYSSAMGRFISPDPLFVAAHRLPDPQMWNLYHYGRNNPLKFTDSTGLDVKLDCSQVSSGQCGQTVDQLNSRKDAQFKVTRDDKTGLLKVDGKVDSSKLSKSEGALYNAISDTDHHATLQVVNQSDMVTFGRFDGNGHNTVDASDMKLLNNASPQAAGEVIAHEALESYGSSFGNGNNYGLWHGYANQFFGQVTNGPENYTFSNRGGAYYTQDWNLHRIGLDLEVKTVITPQPATTVPRAYTPGTIVNVQPANQQNH